MPSISSVLTPVLLIATLTTLSAETRLGKPLTLKQSVSVGELMTNPSDRIGKTVQVKGKVTETCQMMGCWMSLVDQNSDLRVRVKVKDGDLVFQSQPWAESQ